MVLILTSSAFQNGGEIPATYTCEGSNISPPLAWTGAPEGTKSLVLIVDDPDAPDPDAPKMTWVHWVLYNIPSSVKSLPQAMTSKDLPAGTKEGISSKEQTAYCGPCPPIGRHRYFYKLYALDVMLPDLHTPTKDKLLKVMEGHILAKAELMGTYKKTGKK